MGVWQKDFDLVSTHHKGNKKFFSRKIVPIMTESNVVFVLPIIVHPTSAIVASRARQLGRTLSLTCGANVQFWGEPSRWYDVMNVDVLIILNEEYDLSKMRHVKTTLFRVIWLSDDLTHGKMRNDLGHFDAIIFASERLKHSIKARNFRCFTRCPLNFKMVPRRRATVTCTHDFSRRLFNSSFVDEQLLSCLDEHCLH